MPVANLRREPGLSRQVRVEGPLSDLGAVSVAVPEHADVVADLLLTSHPGGITASGTVSAPWRGECRRCGGPVAGEVVASVRERFAPSAGPAGADDDAYPLVGDELDLEPLVRDAVVLELPLAPLCTAACLGLCPTCGANRNAEPCSCPAPTDSRWSVLDVLRDQGPAS